MAEPTHISTTLAFVQCQNSAAKYASAFVKQIYKMTGELGDGEKIVMKLAVGDVFAFLIVL